jgi:peptidoglycan lytic transglycosylase D
MDTDKTLFAAARPITVYAKGGDLRKGQRQQRFLYEFKIGRGQDCDLQFADTQVSTNHARVSWNDNQWWIEDLGSKNGTYVDGKRVEHAPLTSRTEVSLTAQGPVLTFVIDEENAKEVHKDGAQGPTDRPEKKLGLTMFIRDVIDDDALEKEEQIRILRQEIRTLLRKTARQYRLIAGLISVFLIASLVALYFRDQSARRVERLHDTAVEIYYAMKSLELEIGKLEGQQGGDQLAEQFARQRAVFETYAREELGISREKMSEEDWLIYMVTRRFGECDVNMPAGFKNRVKEFIQRWQWNNGQRYREAIARAREFDLPRRIVQTILQYNVPPEFFYLAMQESDFKPNAVGKRTRFGIAKGMWQFIPMTARQYDLHVGPFVDLEKADAFDDRHNIDKSTEAAARYLHYLYQTEAKGSGLLVMACYNWGEGKVLKIVQGMPEDPRQRNFWNLLGNTTLKVPDETYDYVFYIVSAAVIGENPRLFGFDFDNPLKPYAE